MDSNRFDLGALLSRRRRLAYGDASLSAFALSSRWQPLSAQDATPEASPVSGQAHPAFMFVQLADAVNWVPKPGEDQGYLLSLSGIGDQTLYFSEGTAGTFPTDHMLKSLGFTPLNPPRAAVVVQTPDGVQDVQVVKLFNPIFTQDDAGNDQLTYETHFLDAYIEAGLEEWVPRADDDELSFEFTQVSLFIDDCPGITGCTLAAGNDRFVHVGKIPGAPYRQCFDESTGICRLCEGSYAMFDELCREAFPEQCARGVCFTNVCDFAEYFGEMYYC